MSFEIPSDPNINTTNTQLDPIKEIENKNPIGQGKSLADLKKLAQLAVIKKDTPMTKSLGVKEIASQSAQSNKSDPNTSESIQTKVNHADKLIELLKSNFSNSRERVIAENKIRRYFGIE